VSSCGDEDIFTPSVEQDRDELYQYIFGSPIETTDEALSAFTESVTSSEFEKRYTLELPTSVPEVSEQVVVTSEVPLVVTFYPEHRSNPATEEEHSESNSPPVSLPEKRKYKNPGVKARKRYQKAIEKARETSGNPKTLQGKSLLIESAQTHKPTKKHTSPADEVKEALEGLHGPVAKHFVSLLIKDRIGSSWRFQK
jgi:hypothetical protein